MDTLIILLLVILLLEVTYLISKQTTRLSSTTHRPIFVDTSVLIDGRIVFIAKSGFIGDTLIIPRSVVGELQFLADNADAEKRSRARHGLDVVRELQDMTNITVQILQDGSKAEEGVDERLLKLAKQYKGAICTIDFNLNKVAQVENIQVLNVNELAKTLRMAYLPGEKLTIGLVQKGQDSHQAVGYLADGTMVVVEQAASKIGQSAEVEFIRSLQTAAGKMMFAKLVKGDASATPPVQKKPFGRKNISPASAPTPMPTPTQSKPQSDNAPSRKSRTPKTKQPNKAATTKQSSRPKTSAQRESSLIEQINNQ